MLEGKNDLHFLRCVFLNSGRNPSAELDEYINEGTKREKSTEETQKLRRYIKNSKFNVLAKVEIGKQNQRRLFRENCLNFASDLYITVIFDLDKSPMDKNIRERIEELRSKNPTLKFMIKKTSPMVFGSHRVDFVVSKMFGRKSRKLFLFSFFTFEDSLESTAKKTCPYFENPLDGIGELSKHFKVSDLFPSDL
ncbi:MAG: hypothetical protein ACYCSO_03840 [Cuniculiplasma sp.]